MVKADAERPARVPAKRRQLESLLDVHIAEWLASDALTPSERRRLQDERARRKAERRRTGLVIGLVVDPAGVTPQQLEGVKEALAGARSIIHSGVPSSRLHTACKLAAGCEVAVLETNDPVHDRREVVRRADLVVIAPSSDGGGSRAWRAESYARHRRVPVKVVLPDGTSKGGTE